jgi:hypothetical protein
MKFSQLNVGEQFKYKDKTYTKINPEKISCCKSLNCVEIENNQKIMVKPTEDVEKVPNDN